MCVCVCVRVRVRVRARVRVRVRLLVRVHVRVRVRGSHVNHTTTVVDLAGRMHWGDHGPQEVERG